MCRIDISQFQRLRKYAKLEAVSVESVAYPRLLSKYVRSHEILKSNYQLFKLRLKITSWLVPVPVLYAVYFMCYRYCTASSSLT
jgi:hypothetical protein